MSMNKEEVTYTIYSLINLDNGKRYIGRTKNLDRRIKTHKGLLKHHTHPNELLNSDSDCQFDLEVLEENIPYSKGKEKERHYIKQYKSYDEKFGYNGKDHCVATIKNSKHRKIVVEEMVINVAKLKRLRLEKGLTQGEFALLIGVTSKTTVCQMEKEPWACTLPTLNRLARALNCSPLSLVKIEEVEIELE